MKQNQPLDNPSSKSKIPYISHNHNNKLRNQSLKKILFNQNQPSNESQSLNSIGLFPKIAQKNKKNKMIHQKKVTTSLDKNTAQWHLPNSHLKKRQKLQTQGQVTEQLSQVQQSFISLTNKIFSREENVKDTMFDFKKKIEMNKLFIKKQIQKKNKENQSSIRREKSFLKKKRVASSRFLDNSQNYDSSKRTIQTPINQSKLEISFKQRNSSKNKNKNQQKHRKRQKTQAQHVLEQSSEKKLPKKFSEGLFTDLQVILDQKIKPQSQNSKQQERKLKELLQKLNRYKQSRHVSAQSLHGQSLSQQLLVLESSTDILSSMGSQKARLKRETNYHQWNKLQLEPNSQISYRKSSFEDQLKKVSEYTDRNDASLEKYLGMRKQLLKLGFQVQIGHQAGYRKV